MSDFDKMKAIARRNGAIGSAPLGNMLQLQRTKDGYQITLGIAHEWGDKVMRDECVGALYLIDKTEFAKETDIHNLHTPDPPKKPDPLKSLLYEAYVHLDTYGAVYEENDSRRKIQQDLFDKIREALKGWVR